MKRALFTITPLIVTVALALSVLLTPRGVQAATVAWSDSLAEYGMPSSPQMWQPSNWDVQTHTRDMENAGSSIDSHAADHGGDCAAPPATHTINTWQQAVFACHSHVMTAIADGGYGEVVLTPDHLADWSAGPVTIGFSVSTQRTTARDWLAITLTPFGEQLSLPFDFGEVDLQGNPAHYIELNSGMGDNGDTKWQMYREQAGNSFGDLQGEEYPYFSASTGIQPSTVTRTPFELTISKAGYTFRVAPSSPVGAGKVLLSGAWSKPLTFSQGVVQFAHHSYNPTKCDVVALSCKADTWHWSDFSISQAVQYTMLRPVDHQVVTQPGGVVTFGSPAPAGSLLKFAAIGNVQVSYDGGKTYSAAQKPPMDASLFHEEHFTNYLTPVPVGATSVLFKLTGGWYGQGMARDFSVMSLSASGSPAPSPTPVPPTPTPVPPTPTPSPAPSPTPITIQDAPCSVVLLGVSHDGTCSGTFTPGK
jgi:hypothetical protein